MYLPWVIFDDAAIYGGRCDSLSEPDLAGLGVVLSFVFGSLLSTIASIIVMTLDTAFDDRGRFSVRHPFKYLQERFLHTEWKQKYAYRPFLDPVIIGLGDQQLMLGYAVLCSGWAKIAQKSFRVDGANFALILYVCIASSSSHLAALITIRKYFQRHRIIGRIRLALVVVFIVFLIASMLTAVAMTVTQKQTTKHPAVQLLAFLISTVLLVFGFTSVFICILYRPRLAKRLSFTSDMPGQTSRHLFTKMTSDPKQVAVLPAQLGMRLVHYVLCNPLIAFTIQILLAVLSVVLVLSQRFAKPDDPSLCGMSQPGTNAWGFGQTLNLLMLLVPAWAAFHCYLEARHYVRK